MEVGLATALISKVLDSFSIISIRATDGSNTGPTEKDVQIKLYHYIYQRMHFFPNSFITCSCVYIYYASIKDFILNSDAQCTT